MADQVNTQLGQGLDLKGQVGTKLFNNFNDPALAALRVRAYSGNSNAQPLLNITDTSVLTTSDYRLEFDGTSYSARRLSDNAPINVTNTAGLLSFKDAAGRDQGFTVDVNGPPAPAAGDLFQLQPTRRGAASISTVLDQPDQLAFAAPVRSQALLQNIGSATIGQPELKAFGAGANPMTALKTALTPAVTMAYNALTGLFSVPAGATLTRINTDGSNAVPPAFQPSQQNTYKLALADGSVVQMTISGRPENNDQFQVGFNTNGVSDNRNALKLADLQNKQTVGLDPLVTSISTGTSFTDGYGDLVERVGTLTAQARTDSAATTSILKQATDNRDSLSAVNLDEEAANLIKFEQYYNASAQVIQVARSLFDTLINTFR